MQNGHSVTTAEAPVASACRVRSSLMRVPRRSSIHIRPPPAPQQKDARSRCSISRSSMTGSCRRTSRGSFVIPL